LKKNIRIIAPDLIGFGLSSKVQDMKLVGSVEFHVEIIVRLVRALDLKEFFIVGQDWGGPISAGVAAKFPNQVKGAVFSNTTIMVPQKFRSSLFHRFARAPLISDIAFKFFYFPIPYLYTVQANKRSFGKEEKKAYFYPFRLGWRDRLGI